MDIAEATTSVADVAPNWISVLLTRNGFQHVIAPANQFDWYIVDTISGRAHGSNRT